MKQMRTGSLDTCGKQDSKYLDWMRKQPCVVCRRVPSDPDHHPSRGSGRGTDRRTYPVCRMHHVERHRIGIYTFQRKYGIDVESEISSHERRYEKWMLRNKSSTS